MRLQIENLFVSNRRSPINTDPQDISFSWQYECEERGSEQASYSIIVSSGRDALEQGNGDVWDSGIKKSPDNMNAPYKGRTLENGKRYWWKVYLWDEKGRLAESSAAFFDVCLGKESWKAKWIWKSETVQINDFAFFRKTMTARDGLETAKIYASAHNYLELFINGTKVSGYMSPAHSEPQKSKLYLTYDITSLIKEGKNAVCAIVHYLGGSGQNYINGLPGFIAQLELDYKDGTRDAFLTDDTWACLDSTPYKNNMPFQQNRRLSAIESYDANLEPEGWLEPAYDDSHWERAVISLINDEGWELKPQTIPEGAVETVTIPTSCGFQQPGIQVFDAGKIITGWARIRLPGKKGICVRIRYSENLDEAGRVKHNVTNETSHHYYDEYIMKGNPTENWDPHFSYKAFRYLEVTGYPDMIEPSQLEVISAHTALDYLGSFSCSEPLLIDLYTACIQTQKNNVMGQMVDCPHREQAQYLGDSDLQSETFGYNFLNPEVLEKVLNDFKDTQDEDGTFPFVSPCNSNHPDFALKIPEYDLHYCSILWKLYMLCGNAGVINKYYDTAKQTLDHYLGTRDHSTGLIPKSKEWHISDWPYSKMDQNGRFLTVQNCLTFDSLVLMSKMAEIIGNNHDASRYSAIAESLESGITKHLIHPEKKLFVDSFGGEATSQGANAAALHYGLVPDEYKSRVLDFIVSEGLNCRTILSFSLLKALFENGRQDAGYRFISKTDFPGWGFMITKGAQTIWEGFDDIESHCHAWNAYPARFLVEYIVGIKNTAPGFKNIEISPFLAEGLTFAEGKVPTFRGVIGSKWVKDSDNKVLYSFSIPSGGKAVIRLPFKKDTSVVKKGIGVFWARGQYIPSHVCVKYLQNDEFTLSLEIGSGDYCFEVDD